jgi:hypothetical protein
VETREFMHGAVGRMQTSEGIRFRRLGAPVHRGGQHRGDPRYWRGGRLAGHYVLNIPCLALIGN